MVQKCKNDMDSLLVTNVLVGLCSESSLHIVVQSHPLIFSYRSKQTRNCGPSVYIHNASFVFC